MEKGSLAIAKKVLVEKNISKCGVVGQMCECVLMYKCQF